MAERSSMQGAREGGGTSPGDGWNCSTQWESCFPAAATPLPPLMRILPPDSRLRGVLRAVQRMPKAVHATSRPGVALSASRSPSERGGKWLEKQNQHGGSPRLALQHSAASAVLPPLLAVPPLGASRAIEGRCGRYDGRNS